jgi:hypothetical protein
MIFSAVGLMSLGWGGVEKSGGGQLEAVNDHYLLLFALISRGSKSSDESKG